MSLYSHSSSKHLVIYLMFVSLLCCPVIINAQTIEPAHEVLIQNTNSYNGTEIFSNTEIQYPGIYRLSKSTVNGETPPGIIIRSDDVFLDGNGITLNGTDNQDDLNIGIWVHNSEKIITNITITNISVSGFNNGLSFDGVKNGTIMGCSLIGNAQSGLIFNNVSQCTIINSELSANRPSDGLQGGSGIIVSDSESVVITKDRILANGRGDEGDGISISDSSDISIEQTTISKNAKTGIRAEDIISGLIIRENIISSNGENGISLGSGCIGPILSDNRISDNLMTAVEIRSCKQGVLTGNIGESGRIGISLSESEEFSLSNNEFKGNTINFDVTGNSPGQYNHAIDTSNRADGRSIWYVTEEKGLQIGPDKNPSCVYAVNSSDILISDLIFNKNGAGIFLINSRNVSVSDIAALDNAYGIRVGYESSDISITRTSAEKNLFAGYGVGSSENITFQSCSAQNSLIGFLIASSQNITCTDCHAIKQQGLRKKGPSGFLVSGSNRVKIVNSSSKQNQFDGIYLKDSPGTVISSTNLTSNDIAGIAVLSEEVYLFNNNISSNKAGGVLIYGNGTTLQGNRINMNTGRGIIIDDSDSNQISDNLFNNVRNLELTGSHNSTIWNITPISGLSIIGGNQIGGNYWGSPDKTGFSDTCSPGDDGFCSAPFNPVPTDFDFHPLTYQKYESQTSDNSLVIQSMEHGGDINQNGREDLQDVVVLMEKIGTENITGIKYDFSGDKKVNLQDVIALFQKISL